MRIRRAALWSLLALTALAVGWFAWTQGGGTRGPRPEEDGRAEDARQAPPSLATLEPAMAPPAPPPPPAASEAGAGPEVGVLTVFVTDEEGTSIEGAAVRVFRDGGLGSEPRIDVTTAEDGTARFDALPVGSYWVSVKRDGFTDSGDSTNVAAAQPARVNVRLRRAVLVQGRVVRAEDGTPMEGVSVSVWGGGSAGGRTVIWEGMPPLSTTTTAADGSFRIGIAADRIRTVRAIAEGRAQASASVLRSAAGEAIVLRLAPGGTLRGLVRAPDGKACPGARVFVVPDDQPRILANPRLVLSSSGGSFWSSGDGRGTAELEGEGEIHRAWRTTADGDGRFVVAHLALPARVRVLAEGPDGARGGTLALDLEEGAPEVVAEVRLEPRAVLVVRVLDTEDRPARSASVAIEGVALGSEGPDFLQPRGLDTWSDPTGQTQDGAFHFEGLSLGTYTAVVTGPAGEEVRADVELTRGGKHAVTVRVQPAPVLEGIVVDEAGEGVPHARVRWGAAHGQTDEHGRFCLEGPGGGERDLEASSEWHLPARLEALETGEPVRVVVVARPVVTGILVPPPGGESLRDHIWIVEDGPRGERYQTAQVDAAGRFRFPLMRADEETRLLLLPRGAADVLLGPFRLSAGTERSVGEVQLDLGRTLVGTVVDGVGQPVAGAMVRAGRPGLLDLRDGMFVHAPESTTAADGSFRIEQVHRGPLALRVRHAEHAPAVVENPPGPALRIVVGAAAFLAGVVRAADGTPQGGLGMRIGDGASRHPAPGSWAQTDTQGRYRLGPLTAGEHRLSVHREGKWVDLGSVRLRAGETTARDVTLP